ncbi:MAG: YdcF family protein, partial [Blastochloris sp.]|nr:YdcF family protein [Blastochloris sp.]
PVVICTGGFPYSQVRSEASACAELLRESGVPANAILLEERSRSTEENAFYAEQIMETNGYDDAVLVSDTFHMLRAQWIFGTIGITVYTSPATRRPPAATYAASIGREVVALHWQVFKTVLNLPVTYVPWV